MINGDRDSGSHRRDQHGKRNLFRGNDFAYALTRMAVAQICETAEINTYQGSHTPEGARFSSFHESAIETLTDVVIQYIQSIGKTATFYANVSGRVEVKDIIRYTGEAEEIPFPYSLPPFPFNKGKRPAPSFFAIGAEPPDEHIPAWLPTFPKTIMSNGSEEIIVDKVEGDKQSREDEQTFSSLQQAIDVDRLKVQKSMDQRDVQKPTEELEGNPFLAAPLWVGEKKVPPLVYCSSELTNEEVGINHVPEKHMRKNHHVPALEAYAPSEEINYKTETEDGQKKDGARIQRTLVSFKIGTRKASVCWTINQSLEEKGWFQVDGDERKMVEREENRESVDTDVK